MDQAQSPPLDPIPSQPEETAPRRLGWWVHLVVLTAFPVLIGVMSIGRSAHAEPALTHSVRGLLITSLLQMGVFAVFFGVAWLGSKASGKDLLLPWRRGCWPVLQGVAYSFLLRFALGVLAVMVAAILVLSQAMKLEDLQRFSQLNRPDVGALVDISALRQNPVYFWLTLTLVSFVVAGLREELWRSALLAGLRRLWPRQFGSRGGQFLGVSLAAVVFGAGHVAQGPMGMVVAGLLGLGLGIIMVIHDSIWPAVIAHGMFDATTFALLPALAKYLQ
jgi:membrane protease YdiL (CAAX protease family)